MKNQKLDKFTGLLVLLAFGLAFVLIGFTYPLWAGLDKNDSPSPPITEEKIYISPVTAGEWTDESNRPIMHINDFRMAPGDSLQYLQTFRIQGTDSEVTAELTVTYPKLALKSIESLRDKGFILETKILDTGTQALLSFSAEDDLNLSYVTTLTTLANFDVALLFHADRDMSAEDTKNMQIVIDNAVVRVNSLVK